jgi:hypothetical protein
MQLGSHGPEEVDASAGYEQQRRSRDGHRGVSDRAGIFVAVTGVLCYGIGKIINAHMDKEDGPNSKWTKTADIRQLGNLPNNPEMQNKVAQLTQQFPTPRLQTRRRQPGDCRPARARRFAAEQLQLASINPGQGEDSHRARDGTDCAARTAGGAGSKCTVTTQSAKSPSPPRPRLCARPY